MVLIQRVGLRLWEPCSQLDSMSMPTHMPMSMAMSMSRSMRAHVHVHIHGHTHGHVHATSMFSGCAGPLVATFNPTVESMTLGSDRWPLIPVEQLHASSVQHPDHPEWRWLLHSRRIPVIRDTDVSQLSVDTDVSQLSVSQRDGSAGAERPAEDLPPCAGIGDPTGIVWACWDCLQDLCSKRPQIPLNALVNDNWIGRENVIVREASVATKTLLSIGRACWKQVRLGKGAPDMQQKGICGNTIIFAQPTADIPSMDLPPPTDALVDSFNIIFTRKLDDLRFAKWATVKRDEYMTLARQRKEECATFAHVALREDLATTRLPEDGIPDHILLCTQHVDGAEKAPVAMLGPASRAPELGKDEVAGEGSDRSDDDGDDEDVDAAQLDTDYVHDNVAESTIALDPVHDVAPVRMMQALQGTIEAVSAHAMQIQKNETNAQIADHNGVLQPVVDEGGRHRMKSLVLDVQQVVSSFDEKSRAALETAQAGTDRRRAVCPSALAIPTQQPLDSFDARTWPATYPEWWYGDGAPNLDRQRPMLFEEVARRLINIEELEYTMRTDSKRQPYEASHQSRFNTPEIIAVLGDVVRRLRLLKGTRAAINRKGFSTDLKILAAAR